MNFAFNLEVNVAQETTTNKNGSTTEEGNDSGSGKPDQPKLGILSIIATSLLTRAIFF